MESETKQEFFLLNELLVRKQHIRLKNGSIGFVCVANILLLLSVDTKLDKKNVGGKILVHVYMY